MPAPVFEVTAVTHREKPIYHAINGYGRETIMLRKYVLEASLLKVLQAAVPIVTDAEMTAGGLHRFHAVVQVKKATPQHDGLQRNAIFAAFGALKDLDLVIVVDEDIDIRDPHDVEYALATRMEASRDLIVMPAARGHEYIRAGQNGIRAKLGIDATVPFAEKARFARCVFEQVTIDRQRLSDRCGRDPGSGSIFEPTSDHRHARTLCRASTPLFSGRQNADGRDKPGHDERQSMPRRQ